MNCRLLYLVGQLSAGGSERQLYYLLKTIDRAHYRPGLVVWSFRETDTYVLPMRKLGIPLHSFPYGLLGAGKLYAFRNFIMKLRPEIIHSYSFYTNFAAWWATRGITTIPIGSSRSNFTFDREDCGPLLGRLSGRWPRQQIYNSFSAVKNVHALADPFRPKHISVVQNGIDLQSFRMIPVSSEKRTLILGIGSLVPLKRWDRVITAAAKLKARGFDCVIRIAGDGPLRSSLEQQTKDCSLADRLEFLGHSDDIPALLRDATFLIHTSDIEGCPNAVMEAMACGRAVIATNVGDVLSLVEDGKTGFVVNSNDDDKLVDRMIRLITDRDLCRRMGEAGQAKAEREFGLDRLVSETLAAYELAGWRDS